MNIDDDAKLYLWWDATLTFDPTGSTVEIEIDATRYPMTWQGAPVAAAGSWTQTARTTSMFAGSNAGTVGAPVVLTVGRHLGQPIVSVGGQVVPCQPSVPIDVS